MTFVLLLALAAGLLAGQQASPTPSAAVPRASRSNAALVKDAREAYDRGEKAAFLSIYEELARRRPGEVFTLYNLACGQALNGRGEAGIRTLEEPTARPRTSMRTRTSNRSGRRKGTSASPRE